jgi:hypothetical protein
MSLMSQMCRQNRMSLMNLMNRMYRQNQMSLMNRRYLLHQTYHQSQMSLMSRMCLLRLRLFMFLKLDLKFLIVGDRSWYLAKLVSLRDLRAQL